MIVNNNAALSLSVLHLMHFFLYALLREKFLQALKLLPCTLILFIQAALLKIYNSFSHAFLSSPKALAFLFSSAFNLITVPLAFSTLLNSQKQWVIVSKQSK